MKAVILLAFCLLISCNHNSPVGSNTNDNHITYCTNCPPHIVDFAPITVGNTWVYSQSFWMQAPGIMNNGTKIIIIKVTKVVVSSSDTMFDVTVRDSSMSSDILGNLLKYDTTYFVDSIVKRSDTIINAGYYTYFSISAKDTTNSAWGFNSIRHPGDYTWNEHYGYCKPYNKLAEYIQVKNVSAFVSSTSSEGDSSVFLENIGLVYKRSESGDGHINISGGSTLTLETFNGKTPEEISQLVAP